MIMTPMLSGHMLKYLILTFQTVKVYKLCLAWWPTGLQPKQAH